MERHLDKTLTETFFLNSSYICQTYIYTTVKCGHETNVFARLRRTVEDWGKFVDVEAFGTLGLISPSSSNGVARPSANDFRRMVTEGKHGCQWHSTWLLVSYRSLRLVASRTPNDCNMSGKNNKTPTHYSRKSLDVNRIASNWSRTILNTLQMRKSLTGRKMYLENLRSSYNRNVMAENCTF